jgi:hypothetical protein
VQHVQKGRVTGCAADVQTAAFQPLDLLGRCARRVLEWSAAWVTAWGERPRLELGDQA